MPERMKFRKAPGTPRVRENRPNSHRRGYGGAAWEAIRMRVLVRDSFQCRKCSRICSSPREAHVDHIQRRAETLSDDLEGLQTLCASCHGKKTAREQADLRGRQEGP